MRNPTILDFLPQVAKQVCKLIPREQCEAECITVYKEKCETRYETVYEENCRTVIVDNIPREECDQVCITIYVSEYLICLPQVPGQQWDDNIVELQKGN